MSIPRRSDYACRIIRAAYRNGEGYISIAEVAEEEFIPYAFARSIQHDLVKAGMLKTTRGVNGGLTLACDADTTTLYDVVQAVSGGMAIAECTCPEFPCQHKETCSYNAVWRAAEALLNNLFASITLTDLFEKGESHPAIQAALALSLPEKGE